MQKTRLGLIAAFSMACCSIANAASVASVSAVASPAWMQQDEVKTDLDQNSQINFGDHVYTGETGRLELELRSGVRLRIYPLSHVSLITAAESATDSADNMSVLYFHAGRICLESPPASSSGINFRLNLADMVIAEIQQYGHICVSRREGMSSVNLRAGSVQISNSIDPGIIILSEAGIEFRMDDEGSYQLLPSATNTAFVDMKQEPFIVLVDVEPDTAGSKTPESDTSETESAESQPDIAVSGNSGTEEAKAATDYIYTVYLFSTRSEEVAQQANERFQQAGHKTLILTNEKDSPVRYRIAVSGFQSRQSAKDFADSIVGTLGIRDTWIGENRSSNED